MAELAPVQLKRVRRASANTGHFRVSGSRCWPQPARLKNSATTLAILTEFENQKSFDGL